MAEKHIIETLLRLSADTSQFRKALGADLQDFSREVQSRTQNISTSGARRTSAQSQIATRQVDVETAIGRLEKSGQLPASVAADLRQAVRETFDQVRQQVAQAARVEALAPPTPKQYAAGERRYDRQAAAPPAPPVDVNAEIRARDAVRTAARDAERSREEAERQARVRREGTRPLDGGSPPAPSDLAVRSPRAVAERASAEATATEAARDAAAAGERLAREVRERAAAESKAASEADEDRMYGGRPLTGEARSRFRREMTPRDPGDPTTAPAFQRAEDHGVDEALRRLYGLMVGFSQELEQSTPELAEGLQVLRANNTALKVHREALEKAAEQQLLYNNLTGQGDRDLYAATRDLALIRERTALVEGRAVREGTRPLIDDQGAAAREKRIRAAEVELAASRDYDPETGQGLRGGDKDILARVRAQRERLANELGESAAVENRSQEATELAARRRLEESTTRRAVNTQQSRFFAEQGGYDEGSWFQRMQARISARQGQAPRSPLDYQTGKQFVTSKALTSGGFALTGGLMYGALSLGGDILRESTELQQELSIIQTQFDSLQSTANGITFDQFRRQISATSVDTGVAANEVANVQRQLSGAFADSDTGDPNFAAAASEGRTALRYSKISGLPQQEITDSLTAVSLAFRSLDEEGNEVPLKFEAILDTITDLENRFGVLGPEILKFTADLAPLGKELGLTQAQLAGLGAVAQQASGKSGQVLAEQLGRILPSMKEKSQELYDLFESNVNTRPYADALADAFAGGESDKALSILVKQYGNLDKAQKNTLANLVGGKREAATFYALLDRGKQTLNVLDPDDNQGAGSFDKRWESYKETVTYAIDQMRRTVEEFGQALFEMGIADVLTGAADAATLLAGAVGGLVKIIGALNDAFLGVPLKAAGMLAVFKIVSGLGGFTALSSGIAAARTAQAGQGGFGIGAALLNRNRGIGGFGSIYSRSIPGTPLEPGVFGPVQANNVVRPSVRIASKLPIIGPRITDASGVPIPGAAGAAAGAGVMVAGLAATFLASYALDYMTKLRGEMQATEDDVREKIARDLKNGKAASAIRASRFKTGIGPGGSFVGKGRNFRDLGLGDQILAGFRSAGQKFADDPFTLGIGGEDVEDRQLKVFEEEVAKTRADTVAAQGQAVLALKDREYQSTKKAIEGLLGRKSQSVGSISDPDNGPSQEVRDLLTGYFDITYPADQGGIPDFTVSKERLQKIVDDIEANPGEKKYQDALELVLASLYGGGQDTEGIVAELNTILANSTKEAQSAVDEAAAAVANDQLRGQYEQRLERKTNAFKTGTGPLSAVISEIRKRRDNLATRIRDGLEAGWDVTEMEQELAKLDELAGSTIVDDILNESKFTAGLVDASGASDLQKAEINSLNTNDVFERISNTREATLRQRADAAMDLIAAQQEEFDQKLKAATSQAEADRLFDEGLELNPQARRDIIGVQLSSGRNSQAIDTLSKFFDTSTAQARGMVADAVTSAGGLNQSLLRAMLEGRRKQLEGVREELKGVAGPGAFFRGQESADAAGDIAQVEAAIAAIDDIKVTDFGGTVGAGDDAARLEDARSRSQAKLALAKARAGTDQVAAARADVDAARQLLQLANQGSDQNVKDEALASLITAENQLNEILASRSSALRQSAFDLRKAQAPGDAVTQANIDVEAARAALADADTPEDRAAGIVALQNALNAQYDAAVSRRQQEGAYLASLLQGDSVGQARQEVANATQALASARPDQRFQALQDLADAQRNLQTSLLEVFLAQKDLAISVAEGAGKTVDIALIQLQQAQARLAAAKAAGAKGAQLDAAQADVNRAGNNLIVTARQDRLGDLDYLYEFDKITAQQYIASLTAELAKIPESNKDARREIERRIKSLREEMGQDLQFNLPDVRLGSFMYEAARLNDTSISGGASSYQDNRVYSFVFPDITDPDAAARAVASKIDGPTDMAPSGRIY